MSRAWAGRSLFSSRQFRGSVGVACAVLLLASGFVGVPAAAAEVDTDASDLPALKSDEAPVQKLEKPVAADDDKFPEAPGPSERNQVDVLGKKDQKHAPLPSAEPRGQGFVKGQSERDTSSTTPFQDVYDNPDGSHTMLLSPVPARFKDGNGHWTDVDLTLVDGNGGKRPTASPFPVTLLSDPSEGLTRLETEDGPLVTRLANVNGLQNAKVSDSPNEVRWTSDRNVAARASVTTSGINHDVVLKDPTASASYRFELVLPQDWSARQAPSNGIELIDAAGQVQAFFGGGLAHDSSSPSAADWAETPVVVTLVGVQDGVASADVAIDSKWLADEKREFPVIIDPTTTSWLSGNGQGFDTYVDYFQPNSSFGTLSYLKAGSFNLSNDNAYLWFPLTGGPPISHDTTISQSTLTIYNTAGPSSAGHPMSMYGIGEWWNESITWNLQPGSDGRGPRLSGIDPWSTAPFGEVGWLQLDTIDLAESWIREGQANWGLMFKAGDSAANSGRVFESGNHAWYWPQLSITWTNGPKESIPIAPANNSVLPTTTPTLSVQTATDEPVAYLYRVTTSPDAESGSVVWDSDWLTSTTSSTIPAGRLVDGGVYFWHVWTFKSIGGVWTVNRPTWVRRFQVELGLGAGGGSPGDALGPVNVNLASGNANVTVSGPVFEALGGDIGASFTYNSQQPFANGLLGRYYANATLTGDPKMQRLDSTIGFDWNTGSPGPGVPADNFSARWSGYITVPSSGNWTFSSINDYGVRVWVDNTLVLDRWSTNGLPNCGISSLPISLTAGKPVPIKVEYRENTGNANFYLSADAPGGVCTQIILSSSWLTPDAPALPTGWTLSADLDGGIAASGGQLVGNTFVITNTDGSTDTYSWTGSAWKPPSGEDSTLTGAPSGELTLQDPDGSTTVFNTDGTLKSATSPLDDAHPAALNYLWTGNPPRLSTITDPVSQRSVAFKYQNVDGFDCPDPTGAGFDANPPPSMLCRIDYWDGTSTKLFYNQAQLARVENAGGSITDFAYDNGKLTKLRDVLAADAVAAGIRADNDTTRWLLEYANGRVQSITAPEPNAGEARPKHTFTYDVANKTASVAVAGINGLRTVTWNDEAHQLTDKDPTDKTTTVTWNDLAHQPETSTDPAGLRTTMIFDDAYRDTDTYGPAPAAWFGTDNKPLPAYVSQIPHSQTRYDEGISGLQVAYWNSKTLTGPTVAHDTGNVGSNGTVDKNWGTASPVPGVVNTDGWSARLTGEITIPNTGVVVFRTYSDDGSRLYIDDQLVVDGWTDGAAFRGGDFNNLVANSKHRIRVEYYDNTGAAELHLYWNWQGQSATIVPGTNLKPRYGLVTSQVEPDGKASAMGYAVPHLGLPTSETVDPGGLNLTTTTGFEPSGTGYYRRTTRTLPAGNQWTYTSYGDAETRANPCGAGSANQAGMQKSVTYPDPDNAPGGASPRVEEFVYDAAGRVVATRVNSDPWSCSTYDTRGRLATATIPAYDAQASTRTVTYDYAVGGNPLQGKVSDPEGSTQSVVDLLGRVRSYTDVWGETTTTSYDQAGRATDNAGPLGAQHVTYDDAGRPTAVTINGNTVAVPAYDTAGRLNSVSYPSGTGNAGNGTSLAPIARDSLGRVTGLTWRDPASATITADAVTLSLGGRVTDQSIDGVDASPGNSNFTYDGAGRLDIARVPGHTLDYDYVSTGGCGPLSGAGKNTNRTALTDNGGSPITYCYDYADRLVSTTEPQLPGNITYDSHGNTNLIGGQTFTYDGADRHVSSSRNGTTVTYRRDAGDRIIERHQTGPGSIAWRATSSASTDGTTTTVTVTKPVGTQTGDVLIAQVSAAGGTTTTITPPSGWTEVAAPANGTGIRAGAYWKVATDTDPVDWTWTLNAAQPAAAAITAYSGVDTTNPIDASASTTATATSNHDAPAVTTTGFGDLLVTTHALASSVSVTPPIGSTERADLASTGTTPVTLEAADVTLGAPGNTGTRTATSSLATDSVNLTMTLKAATIDEVERYGYTMAGDSPNLVLDAAGNILERTYGLPGGAALTKRAVGDVWSYPNLHGDIVATANGSGIKSGGTFTYDPYGTPLSGLPNNLSGEYDNGWLGGKQRGLEHGNGLLPIIEMGARQYLPLLGRFLELDPEEGGSCNDYEYVCGDPINKFDLGGESHCKKLHGDSRRWCKNNKKKAKRIMKKKCGGKVTACPAAKRAIKKRATAANKQSVTAYKNRSFGNDINTHTGGSDTIQDERMVESVQALSPGRQHQNDCNGFLCGVLGGAGIEGCVGNVLLSSPEISGAAVAATGGEALVGIGAACVVGGLVGSAVHAIFG